MNKLEKDNIIQQIENMEQESDLDSLKDLIKYLKQDMQTC